MCTLTKYMYKFQLFCWNNTVFLCLTDEYHTLRIMLYSLIFFLSVFGNLLIIIVLTVNKRMRTVTNTFLLSLAVSDLMMAIFCIPFNLIPSILKDFIFGAPMCKIVVYLMGESKQTMGCGAYSCFYTRMNSVLCMRHNTELCHWQSFVQIIFQEKKNNCVHQQDLKY